MKYVSIDIETLGLSKECSIIEFGAVIDDLKNPKPLEDLPRFHTYLIQDRYHGEEYAMAMHSNILFRMAKRESGYSYLYPKQLGSSFKKFLIENGYEEDKNQDREGNKKVTINVAGKNFMGFDDRFLENLTDFHKNIRVRSRVLDPGPLYYLEGDEVLPSLDKCLERAGHQKVVDHTAIADALDVIILIRNKFLYNN